MVRYHEIIKENIDVNAIQRILNDEEYIKYNPKEQYIDPNTGLVDITCQEYAGIKIRKDLNGKLPVRFGKIIGNFDCSETNITSLEGSPNSVTGDFYCISTNITSLKGAPDSVTGEFNCFKTNITSLKGAPRSVTGDFFCVGTNITSLKGLPSNTKTVYIYYCWNLKLYWDDPNIDRLYIDLGTKGIVYHDELPLLKTLDLKFPYQVCYDKSNENHMIVQDIMKKYRNNTSMSLSEKRIRCKLELLEYPEYEGNAEW